MARSRTAVPFNRSNRTGVATLELAVLLPLLITLCLVAVDFGRFAYMHLAISNAARVAAEYGATNSYSAADADSRKSEMKSEALGELAPIHGISASDIEVLIEVEQGSHDLNHFRVTVTCPFMTSGVWPFIPRPLYLSRSVSFQRFR